MKSVGLRDIDLLRVGHSIQIVGGVWQGQGKTFLTIFPNESVDDTEVVVLKMDREDWEKFLHQTDVLETEILQNDGMGVKKAIVRKSQRQIDGNVQWACWMRDEFTCRYCGRVDAPLTIDHVITWESGGATVLENLLSSCKKCNRTRGNMEYEDWLKSEQYRQVSRILTNAQRQANELVLGRLSYLRTLKTVHRRSR